MPVAVGILLVFGPALLVGVFALLYERSDKRKLNTKEWKTLAIKQDQLLTEIRETAWQYRDIEPVSTTLIIGKIKKSMTLNVNNK